MGSSSEDFNATGSRRCANHHMQSLLFVRFLSDGKITKRVMSVRAQPLPLREHHESLDPTLQAASHKPPLFVQDPFLPFYVCRVFFLETGTATS